MQNASDILDLASRLDRTLDLTKKISQRQALADNRHKRHGDPQGDLLGNGDEPPPGATKEQLRRHFLRGKSHIEIARIAMKG